MENNRERIEKSILKLEYQAKILLESVEIEELTAKERMELALKCMGHIRLFVVLYEQLETEIPEGRTTLLMAAIMRRMRGDDHDLTSLESSLDDLQPG